MVRKRIPLTNQERVDSILNEALMTGQKVHFLCEGSPPDLIRQDWRGVVFTSPNKTWLDILLKIDCALYLPTWTCSELQEAAKVLGYPLTDDEMEKRFKILGGIARYNLSRDQLTVSRAMRGVVEAVEGITKPRDLQILILVEEDHSTRQLLFHQEPRVDRFNVDTVFASSYVESELFTFVRQVSCDEQELLRKATEHGGPLGAWIWEIEAHEVLRRGCKLHLRALQHDTGVPSLENITIEPTQSAWGLDIGNPSSANYGQYQMIKPKSIGSIDAFYLPMMPGLAGGQDIAAWWDSNPDKCLVFFLMTTSKTHGVDAFGIIHVLDKLGLLESVVKAPWRVLLVFVVPGELANVFQRQRISVVGINCPQDFRSIKGVDTRTAETLAKYDIYTVARLEAAIEGEGSLIRESDRCAWNRAVRCWTKHKSAIVFAKHIDAVASIPQYVNVWSE